MITIAILIIGVLGLLVSLIAALVDFAIFLEAWLVASVFWISIPLGALALRMLHRLTGGAWGIFARPALDSAIFTLPLGLVVFIPLVGASLVFPWAGADATATGPTTAYAAYFSLPAFILRSLGYFLIWGILAALLNMGDSEKRSSVASAIGLILWLITTVLFVVDWILGLSPDWSVKSFPVAVVSGMVMTALTWLVLSTSLTGPTQLRDEALLCSDLARMLFAAICFWLYLMFIQYLVVWTGNLPDQITWYLERRNTVWQILAWLFFVVMTVVAIGGLSGSQTNFRRSTLIAIASVLLVAEMLAAVWLILPSTEIQDVALVWAIPAALLGLGGIWTTVFRLLLRRRVLRQEALRYG